MRFSEREVTEVVERFSLPEPEAERLVRCGDIHDIGVGEAYDGVALTETDRGYRLDVADGEIVDTRYAIHTGIIGVHVSRDDRHQVYVMRPGVIDPIAVSKETWNDAGKTVESLYMQKHPSER